MKIKPAFVIYQLFILLGLASMAYATWHWYALHTGQMVGQAYCDISQFCSCERVTTSEYGSFLGVPISVFGFMALFALGLLAFTESVSRKWIQLAFVPLLLGCVYFFGVLTFVLEACCINCYLGYVSFFGAFITSFWLQPVNWLPRWAFVAGIVLMGALHFLYIGLVNQPPVKNEAEIERFSQYYSSLRREEIPDVSPFRFRDGDYEADVVITEFADFTCPACARLSLEVMNRVKRIPGVQFVFFPFPLNEACYPDYKGDRPQDLRCDWTRASFCAFEQNRFWDLHDELFQMTYEGSRIPPVNDDILRRMGLDVESFETCMKSEVVQAKMDEVLRAGWNAGIQATPTLFVNGKRIRGLASFEMLWQAIQEERAAR